MELLQDQAVKLTLKNESADIILKDISKLKRTTNKDDLFAYIDSWETNLKTIKTITEL